MLNLADLTSLLVVAACSLSAAVCAHSAKASWRITALFAVAGLIVGVGFAMLSSRLAYRILKNESVSSLALYLLIPAIAISASVSAVVGVSLLILR